MRTTEERGTQERRPVKGQRSFGTKGLMVIVVLFVATLVLYILPAALEGRTAEWTGQSEQTRQAFPVGGPDWAEQDFLPLNDYSRPGTPLDAVRGVVVHYIGNPGTTARQNRSYFASLAESGETSASSHFIIDTDGTVIQCVPLNEVAYCSNSRNGDTIAIEVCHLDESGEFTDAAYDTLIKLLAWLCDTYDLSNDAILRHGDVYEKLCPLYYMENPKAWEQLKSDVSRR